MGRKENVKKEMPRGFWLMVSIGIFILLVIVALVTPVVMRANKTADMSMGVDSAKSVGVLLLDFDNDFGAFPNDETAEKKEFLNDYVGEYSNDYLGQIIAAEYISNEEIFYTEWATGNSKKPDGNFKTREETLAAGECSFSYIKGLKASAESSMPVLLVQMSGDGYKFKTSFNRDRALVLRTDLSVVALRLNKEDHAILPSGKTLFEGGADTVWGEEGFDAENLLFPK